MSREFDSEVFQDSMILARNIRYEVTKMSKIDQNTLGYQILRAAISIPSNIAEGFGRNSNAQIINFLNIANGSCCEVKAQLLILDGEIIAPEANNQAYDLKNLINQTDKIKDQLRKIIYYYTNQK